MLEQLTKTKKPTGDGVCPPEVKRALFIDDLINDRAGTRDLDDGDFADETRQSSPPIPWSDSDNGQPQEQRSAVARSKRDVAPVPCHGAARAAGLELFGKLTEALDPQAQRARDEERANRSFQTTQILTLTQQLRDSQRMIDKLQDQLFDLRNQLYKSDRARSKLELRLQMLQMARGGQLQPLPKLPKRKRLQQEWYPEGGGSVTWITDYGESSPDEDDPFVATPMRFTDASAGQASNSQTLVLQSPAIHREMKLVHQRRKTMDRTNKKNGITRNTEDAEEVEITKVVTKYQHTPEVC